jgi:hypothetical protein
MSFQILLGKVTQLISRFTRDNFSGSWKENGIPLFGIIHFGF